AMAAGVPPFRSYGRGTYWHALNRSRVDEKLRRQPEDVVGDMERALPAEIVMGHVEHHPEIAAALQEMEIRHLLIIRDPQDVVVSLLHWWKRHDEIDAWPFRLFRALSTDEDRLRFLIEGWKSEVVPEDWPRDVDFPDLAMRYQAYRGWWRDPACRIVRFEDLTDESQRPRVQREIAAFLRPGMPAAEVDAALERMEERADPSRSRTFRRGTPGAGRRYLTGSLGERFDEVAGALVQELGYEP
ncbi:MAG TPA: sulfotransferase domain-containing protein, partial [Gemmatimonadota bacterium]|nr:sulfotransferase domain-containing protein [Gemmatimonadota bacterium]